MFRKKSNNIPFKFALDPAVMFSLMMQDWIKKIPPVALRVRYHMWSFAEALLYPSFWQSREM